MKTKLTLTINPAVTHQAKQLARDRGISLSAMVEQALIENTGFSPSPEKIKSFSQRWAGRLELRQDDSVRTRKLKEKYGLNTES